MRRHIKFPQDLSFWQYILIFPITGLYDLKDDLKRDTIEEFTGDWASYLFLTTLWCLAVGGGIYVIYTHPMELLLPLTVILGITFLLVGIPRIIYRLATRNLEKRY